jgi:hypothetical protein
VNRTVHGQRGSLRGVLAFALLLTFLGAAMASPEVDYVDLVRSPSAYKSNAEFRAYLLGIGVAIQTDYVCNEADRAILADPDRIVEALVKFASTVKGRWALEGATGIGGIHYKAKSGAVLMVAFTESFRCLPYEKPKTQVYP